MLRIPTLLALLALATVDAFTIDKTYRPKYRISPVDGSKIALPTSEQLAVQAKEIGVLIHFNIATYINQDGCNDDPSLVPNQSLFDPALLNTDQWMDVSNTLGAKYATLVTKHNCGFTLNPSQVTFETRDHETIGYNYTVTQSPVQGEDVVRKFTDSSNKYGIGHGFYYSTIVNNFLNVQDSEVNATSWAPGQVNITNSTYDQIVSDQLTEIWTKYGALTEIWLDGGFGSQGGQIDKLLHQYQPQAVVFNGCDVDGNCLTNNSIRWIGTEEGKAPKNTWSTGVSNDEGDPHSPFFSPPTCDTTLSRNGRWFFGVDEPLRSQDQLIRVYHETVGRNCLLELDLSPDRSGLIPAAHAQRYKALGDFIRSCYGTPAGHHTVQPSIEGVHAIKYSWPTVVDRLVLMEDQTNGQVIREWEAHAKIVDSNEANGTLNVPWTLVAKGKSVGNKRIEIFDEAITITEAVITATKYADVPIWRSVEFHLCDNLVKENKDTGED